MMGTLQKTVDDYKKLIESGKSLGAIERFYADEIIQIENNDDALASKKIAAVGSKQYKKSK